jgi:hypothetical protein
MALSKSLPTPNTHELLCVVASVAVGAPDVLLALRVAPIAPDPLVPDVSTPVKLTTVSEDATGCDNVAVTETALNGAGANVLQISDVPLCALVRTTSTHVNPAPATLVTVVLVPDP